MKMLLKIFLFSFSIVSISVAQPATNYRVVAIANSITLLPAPLMGVFSSPDDGNTPALPIGFDFVFMGESYQNVVAGSNGYVLFSDGSSTVENSAPDWNGTFGQVNKAALYQLDIVSAYCQYQTIGTAPNRTFVLQYPESNYFVAETSFKLELRLKEGTNEIEFGYELPPTQALTRLATVGIRGEVGSKRYVSVQTNPPPQVGSIATYSSEKHTYNPYVPAVGFRFFIRPSFDLKAISLDTPRTGNSFKRWDTLTPRMTVKNVGWEDLTNPLVHFYVVDTLTDSILYHDSVSIQQTVSGHLQQTQISVSFSQWTVTVPEGGYRCYGITQATKDTSRKNDTVSAAITVSGGPPVSVERHSHGLHGVTLGQNYPNPFSHETVFPVTLETSLHIKFRLFDLVGRPVATLAYGRMPEGTHHIRFENARLPAGMYIARLQMDNRHVARAVIVQHY